MAKRRKQLTSAWDAVIRAAVRTGQAGAMRVASDGRLKDDGHGPRTLSHLLAQGIVTARTLMAANEAESQGLDFRPDVDARTLLDIPLREDAQGMLGLAAIAWRELRDPNNPTLLDALVPVPNDDPVITMRLSAQRIAEFTEAGPTLPPIDAYERRIWYIEIERPTASQPRALVRWRATTDDGKVGHVRMCAVWTHGRDASVHAPLVVSMSWRIAEESVGKLGGMRWPLFDGYSFTQYAMGDRVRARYERLKDHDIPVVTHRAIQAWALAENMGRAPEPGRFCRELGQERLARKTTDHEAQARDQERVAQELLGRPLHTLASCPHGSEGRSKHLPPPTALDAVLMAAAQATDHAGFTPTDSSADHRLWSEEWWARAEQGMVMWHVTTSRPEEGELVDGRYRFINAPVDELLRRPTPVAIKCASHFMMQILTQTRRAQAIRSRMAGTIHGIRIPPRLWRALGEAGAHPEPLDPFAEDRWWYAEIEAPGPGEPRGVAVWLHTGPDGARDESGIAIWTEGPHASPKTPVVIGWRIPWGTPRRKVMLGWARLEPVPYANGVPGPVLPDEVADHYQQLADTAVQADHSVVARVYAAISEHLTRGTVEPLTLGIPAFGTAEVGKPDIQTGASAPTGTLRARIADSIFQLIRAPDPVAPDPRERARHSGTGQGQDALTERHYVRAHYKRQAYGPEQSLRRVICVEGYWRGPDPDPEHVPLERLADRPPQT